MGALQTWVAVCMVTLNKFGMHLFNHFHKQVSSMQGHTACTQ